MDLEGMGLATLMPFVIKVVKYYLPGALLTVCGIVLVILLLGMLPGNTPGYSPKRIAKKTDSPLKGKRIFFLGSSVTLGFASFKKSFADMLGAADGAQIIKEAVSGTTLADKGKGKSYVERLKKYDASTPVDLFVCQLSTNDATFKTPLGEISTDGSYDTKTVAGSIEWIIDYAKKTWNCPVVFYTNSMYRSKHYAAMRKLLLAIAEKWQISVVDLWNVPELDYSGKKKRRGFMNDQIHPKMKGYQSWLPYFEPVLEKALRGEVEYTAPEQERSSRLKKKSVILSVLKGVGIALLLILLIAVIIIVRLLGDLTYKTDGNEDRYLPENQTTLADSPLRGKTILSVGSSVSYGNGSGGVSFEDYLEAIDGAKVIAVDEGATTIARREGLTSSFLERLERAEDPAWEIDAVILQVSTNDASNNAGLGELTDSYDRETFDLYTTGGGLEYLISYISEKYDAPIMIYCSAPFQSGPLYNAELYDTMVQRVKQIVDKWDDKAQVVFLNQWEDEAMRSVSQKEIVHYMTDPVHPAMAGYLEWWLPGFQKTLYAFFA